MIFDRSYISQLAYLVMAAFVLIISLSWNRFAQNVVEKYSEDGNVLGSFIYAVIITLIGALLLSFYRERNLPNL